MAALTRLRRGTRVVTTRGFHTFSGRYVLPGMEGRIGKLLTYRAIDGVLRVWVWKNKHEGAWVPIGALLRLRD